MYNSAHEAGSLAGILLCSVGTLVLRPSYSLVSTGSNNVPEHISNRMRQLSQTETVRRSLPEAGGCVKEVMLQL